MEVAGANRRWRLQFRYRGSRRESAVAQLFSLGDSTRNSPQQQKRKHSMSETKTQEKTSPLSITVTTDSATRQYSEQTTEATVSALRADILQGAIPKGAKAKFETKRGNAKPQITEGTLLKCASRYAQLADLYMPVRRYARAGILYGIFGGIGLNLILLGLLVVAVNQTLGLAIIALPVCFGVVGVLLLMKKSPPALFMLAPPILSCYICFYVFPQVVGVTFSAVILYSMPGMTIGAIVGAIRRPKIPRAHDAPEENVMLRIAIPLVISIAIWVAYLTLARDLLPKLMK